MYVFDDETPNVVKRIFKEYLEGSGVDSIAKRLTKDGIATPAMYKGKRNAGVNWHGSTGRLILENRAYCGDLVQGKEESASVISKVRIKHDKGIIVEDTHEAIISKEMFWEVQNLIKSRSKGPRPTPKQHLFTDILVCGKCGKSYWYRSYGERYICGSYSRYGKRVCSANAVKESVIKKIVIDELNDILKDYKLNDRTEDKVDKSIQSKTYKVKNEMSILKSKFEKYEEAKANLIISKMTKELSVKEYEISVKHLEKLMNDVDTRIADLEKVNLEVDTRKVQSQLKQVFFGKEGFEDIDRETLFRFVEKIIVHGKDDYEIVY